VSNQIEVPGGGWGALRSSHRNTAPGESTVIFYNKKNIRFEKFDAFKIQKEEVGYEQSSFGFFP
jgi:hypothetical protein